MIFVNLFFIFDPLVTLQLLARLQLSRSDAMPMRLPCALALADFSRGAPRRALFATKPKLNPNNKTEVEGNYSAQK